MEQVFLTQEELTKVQSLQAEFTKSKAAIGDLELQKQTLLKLIENLRGDFSVVEQDLIAKYGKDSVINIQTGEVTTKKEE
jgi:hypothetical protein